MVSSARSGAISEIMSHVTSTVTTVAQWCHLSKGQLGLQVAGSATLLAAGSHWQCHRGAPAAPAAVH
jgi:hypothetical protein